MTKHYFTEDVIPIIIKDQIKFTLKKYTPECHNFLQVN